MESLLPGTTALVVGLQTQLIDGCIDGNRSLAVNTLLRSGQRQPSVAIRDVM